VCRHGHLQSCAAGLPQTPASLAAETPWWIVRAARGAAPTETPPLPPLRLARPCSRLPRPRPRRPPRTWPPTYYGSMGSTTFACEAGLLPQGSRGSHRTPWHPAEDPLDPLQIGTPP
jgi:hypothetical protein